MTRRACQTPQMAVTWENQKGRHFVLLTERISICSTKLRENNSFFLWKMEDSNKEFCLMEGSPGLWVRISVSAAEPDGLKEHLSGQFTPWPSTCIKGGVDEDTINL